MDYSKWFSMNHLKIITHLCKGPMLCCLNPSTIIKKNSSPYWHQFICHLLKSDHYGGIVYLICAQGSFIQADHFHTQLSVRGGERDQPGSEPRGEEHPVLTFKPVLEFFCQLINGLIIFQRDFTWLFKTCYWRFMLLTLGTKKKVFLYFEMSLQFNGRKSPTVSSK